MIKVYPARHELKYFLNQGDAACLAHLLSHIMRVDENADDNGEYHVRSLYFDDGYNSSYLDKINGVRERDKYRIRIYKHSDSNILLEKKTKIGDGIAKTSVKISREIAEQLKACDPGGLEKHDDPLLKEVFRLMRTRMLKPVVLVDYVRQAFVYPVENTRITFDKYLRTGLYSQDLFSPGVVTMPIPDAQYILEVKYDSIFPQFLKSVISSVSLNRSAISKYTLCRQFEPL